MPCGTVWIGVESELLKEHAPGGEMSDSAQVIGRVWNKFSRGPINLRQEGSTVDYSNG